MKKFFLMSLVALVAMTMTSCMHVKIGDNGWSLGGGHKNDTPTQVHQVNETIKMDPFDCLKSVGPFNVIYEIGNDHTVRVEGTPEQLEKMTIYVKDGQLTIDVSVENLRENTFDHMRVFVTSPHIKDITVTGSGTVTAPYALNTSYLELHVTGSGDITIAELKANAVGITVTGSGDVAIGPIMAGIVENTVTGSGDIDIAALECSNLTNSITGSGDINVSNLKVGYVSSKIAGSGDIKLQGTAETHEEKVTGSGDIDISGLK